MVIGGKTRKFKPAKRGGGRRSGSTRGLDNEEGGGEWDQPRDMPPNDSDNSDKDSDASGSDDDGLGGIPNTNRRPVDTPIGFGNTPDASDAQGSAKKLGNAAPAVIGPKEDVDSELDKEFGAAPQLSRREREALDKQKAKDAFWKAQQEGRTEQARADLARLAIIRKQREEAAQKKAAEQSAKNSASASKSESLNAGKALMTKTLGKKK